MCFSSLCRDGLGDTPITDEVFSEFDHSSQREFGLAFRNSCAYGIECEDDPLDWRSPDWYAPKAAFGHSATYDGLFTEKERRVLSLAVHGHCLALRLIMIDMFERKIYTGNVSLFAHQVWEHLPVAFESRDVADHITERLEAVFGQLKYFAKRVSDKRNITRTLVERVEYTKDRKSRHPDYGSGLEPRQSTVLAEYRRNNPLGNIRIPSYLVIKHNSVLRNYLRVILQEGSFGFRDGVDYCLSDTQLKFVVTDCSSPSSCLMPETYIGIINQFGDLPSNDPIPEALKEYKTMDTPSLTDLRCIYLGQRTKELEKWGNEKLQAVLFQICKDKVTGKKLELVQRICDFMKNQFGDVTSLESALATPAITTAGSLATVAAPSNGVDSDPSGVLSLNDIISAANLVNAHQSRPAAHHEQEPQIDICWRCMDWSRDSFTEGCRARYETPPSLRDQDIHAAATRHILGQDPEHSWLVSLSKNFVWCLYFATKSVVMRGLPFAVICEIHLSKTRDPMVIDVSSLSSAARAGVVEGKARAWSACANEVLVDIVASCAMAREYAWVVSPNSDSGMKLLDIKGKDQHRAISGKILAFGSFPEWRRSFDAAFPTDIEVQGLVRGLRVRPPGATG
jgi:hypothetical protein